MRKKDYTRNLLFREKIKNASQSQTRPNILGFRKRDIPYQLWLYDIIRKSFENTRERFFYKKRALRGQRNLWGSWISFSLTTDIIRRCFVKRFTTQDTSKNNCITANKQWFVYYFILKSYYPYYSNRFGLLIIK